MKTTKNHHIRIISASYPHPIRIYHLSTFKKRDYPIWIWIWSFVERNSLIKHTHHALGGGGEGLPSRREEEEGKRIETLSSLLFSPPPLFLWLCISTFFPPVPPTVLFCLSRDDSSVQSWWKPVYSTVLIASHLLIRLRIYSYVLHLLICSAFTHTFCIRSAFVLIRSAFVLIRSAYLERYHCVNNNKRVYIFTWITKNHCWFIV